MDDLVKAAETFISKNLGAVLKSADFLQFGVDDVKAMLKLESEQVSEYSQQLCWFKFIKPGLDFKILNIVCTYHSFLYLPNFFFILFSFFHYIHSISTKLN